MEEFFRGIPASGRIAIGTAVVFKASSMIIPKYTISKNEESIEKEIEKLEAALTHTRSQLEDLRRDLQEEPESLESGYIDATILMLEDPLLKEKVLQRLKNYYYNIEWVFNEVVDELAGQLQNSEDIYFRERAPDVLSVGKKVLNTMLGDKELEIPEMVKDPIVFAHTLSPMEMIYCYKSNVKAVVTEIGGKTSHVSIMARDLEIPAIVGLSDVTRFVQTGDRIIVDGTIGTLIRNPLADTVNLYEYKLRESEKYVRSLKKIEKKPCKMQDGHEVDLLVNLDVEEELVLVDKNVSKGIGLLRTEYIFLNRNRSPSEEEQFSIYKRIVEKLSPNEVTIRTIDIGGDKKPLYMTYYEEKNPFLGWRGIRYALSHKNLLKEQIKAIFRASFYGNVRIMFPMVNDLDEIHEILKVVEECKRELSDKSVSFKERIPLGIMVETPSSILLLDRIADYVDFVSVGTNDLIQYTLAIDRGNGKVASVYDPTHPAILRLLKTVKEIADEKDLEVSICGEMAGEPLYVLLLVGLGYGKLSMSPIRIPIMKYILIHSSLEEARKVAAGALDITSKKEVNQFLRNHMLARFKIFEDYFRQNA